GLDLIPFGMRAMMSLRLDRLYGAWGREYSPDYTAAETGLDRFISFGKPADFIGRAAAEAERAASPARRLAAFRVAAADSDVVAYEPVWHRGEVVGFCTSGGYAHWSDMSVALALVPASLIEEGLSVEIEILGEKRPAEVLTTTPFDPEGDRLRG
ncbi:MAG TPA: glycine cleavage T C-terminal barrel domain-containing protein, partial [Sphingomonadaceae bacterium]|nr:glycine cleavage T C-terminal barrel domain-containing protein [Sphingomonadaceae bacterium]